MKIDLNTFEPSKEDLINRKNWEIEAVQKNYNLGLSTIEDETTKNVFISEKENELKVLRSELEQLIK